MPVCAGERLHHACPRSNCRTSAMRPAIGGGRRGRRADQMRAHARALAVLEIAVGGGDAALARLAAVAIAAGAHRAAGFAPEESGIAENAVEARGLGLALHGRSSPAPPWRRRPARRAARAPLRRRPAGRAARLLVQEPMKTRLTGRPASAMPGVQAHVVERAFDRGAPARIGGGRIGHAAGNAEHLARVGAPGDLRLERAAIEHDARGRTSRRRRS